MELKYQPIQTLYNGLLFRCRLEARWAVFFDALAISYQYGPEGYQLPSGWYLPDFYLPTQKYWIEIKGEAPTDQEEELLHQLGKLTNKDGFIFWGGFPHIN